jgi:hypothetical protein
MVEAGTYEVDTLVGSRLRLNMEGGETVFLDAQATTHNEEIESPLAVTVSGEEIRTYSVDNLVCSRIRLNSEGHVSLFLDA